MTKENVVKEENSRELAKIVKELKHEVNQLNGRVSRLEITKPITSESSNNPRIRRSSPDNTSSSLKPTSSTPKPCLVKEACAFDYKLNSSISTSNSADLPASCPDLQKLGHYLKGFYPIKSGKKISLAFCDFTSTSLQGSLKLKKNYF